MPKRRRYASEPFGPAVERLMNETGVTYRALGLENRALRRVSEPPRARQPAGPVERRGGAARKVPRRRAGVFPRVPAAGDHREAGVDARPGRPPFSAFERLTKRGAARLSGWPVGSRQATTGGLGAPPSRFACQTALFALFVPVFGGVVRQGRASATRAGARPARHRCARGPHAGSLRRGRLPPPPGRSRRTR